jgi:hypothetical protein
MHEKLRCFGHSDYGCHGHYAAFWVFYLCAAAYRVFYLYAAAYRVFLMLMWAFVMPRSVIQHGERGPASFAANAFGVGGSPESAERAGRLGLPLVLGYIGGPLDHARRAVDIYRAAGDQAGHSGNLRVGISTHFYAGPTPEAAREVFPYYREYLRPKTPGGRGFLVGRAQFDAGTQRGNAIMIGSSAQLIEKILDAHQVLGLDRFFGQIDGGGLPRALVEDSINRYATEIAPAVRAAITTSA